MKLQDFKTLLLEKLWLENDLDGHKLNYKKINIIYDIFFQCIKDALTTEPYKISFPGFFTLKLRDGKSRTTINPRSKDKQHFTPARKWLSIKVGIPLDDYIAKLNK